jgi:hypothetical protein
MGNEHDRHPAQIYHCQLVRENLFVLADRGVEGNTCHALQTVYPFLMLQTFLTYVEPVCARGKGSVP